MSEHDLRALCAETVESAQDMFQARVALLDKGCPLSPLRLAANQTLVETLVVKKYDALRSISALRVAGANGMDEQLESLAQEPARGAVAVIVHDGKVDVARPPAFSASIDPVRPALDYGLASHKEFGGHPVALDSGDQLSRMSVLRPDVDGMLESAAKRLVKQTTDHAMEVFKARVAFLGIGEALDLPRLAANQTLIKNRVLAR
ncbi:hypothetical protein AMAG_10820 [Allomyces macrogynus ATCC 38327]|uniref:Uncharacterized protein n=1 Tax=Allomyces macrogynus (strain ATCC 38327) TaxID=578462 RepID=A0A0L0SRL5_ALLM3|nr:hypothetical protein AMAG_10820 [Allomyces macrogynus ATCC 38327]|eukprot:KNE65167.1 hypothetical protein AMAG_10820 [Allomyces macrogynus ATCC 38327]